jgi:hypothetical protein
MAAYLIRQLIVHEMERTSVNIAQYGGEVQCVLKALETLEGQLARWHPHSTCPFPNEKSLRRFRDVRKMRP